ncbi:hypothetical protein LTS08_008668 [Lithohypha guttulata]|nr:hypothetical protein LTS08_008668 [Lithohypha guttulata]
MGATEIAIFPLQEGKYPDDANSTAGQVLRDTLNTLTEQPGFQRAYWGREVENPTTLRLFVDWEDVDAHISFTKKDHYKPFLERFGQIAVLDKAKLFHAHLSPHPPDEALSDHVSPVTEILNLYFPTDYSDADQNTLVENMKKMVSIIEKEATTQKASAGGWVVEDIEIPGTSEKGKCYQAFIGWDSVEAHMDFRNHQAFKDNIHLLRQAKDLKHLQVVHYSGTQVNKGAGGVADLGGDASTAIQGEVLNPIEEGKSAPKSRSDGTTTKNNDDLKGAANSLKKERQGRGA